MALTQYTKVAPVFWPMLWFPIVAAHTGVMSFKFSRSGSSWFTQLVGSIEGVYFGGEALGKGQCVNASAEELDDYVMQLVSKPMHKFPGPEKAEAIPTTAYGGYVSTAPPCSEKLDYVSIVRRSRAKVVFFVRSNAVKWAVAARHDNKHAKVCGRRLGTASNLQHGCTFNTNLSDLSLDKFMTTIGRKGVASLENFVNMSTSFDPTDFIFITYEAVQNHTVDELRRFAAFVGVDPDERDLRKIEAERDKVYVKATNDDLRLILEPSLFEATDARLANFSVAGADAHEARRRQKIALCLRDMLHATTAVNFFHDPGCSPSFDTALHDFRPWGLRTAVFADMYGLDGPDLMIPYW